MRGLTSLELELLRFFDGPCQRIAEHEPLPSEERLSAAWRLFRRGLIRPVQAPDHECVKPTPLGKLLLDCYALDLALPQGAPAA